MRSFKLNKNNPIPLYYQLKQFLLENIENGTWKSGDIIPSERELSLTYDISRMTVRQAMKELVNEGRLIREQGKGTFVAEPKISQGLLNLTSFSEDMRERGFEPGAILLETTKLKADHKISQNLNIREGDLVLKIKRVRLADQFPMAIEQTHIPLTRFPEALNTDFTNCSLYKWLEETYDITISYATQTIEVGLPQPDEAEILNISRTMPLLLIERTTLDRMHQPIEHATSIYRGDRYKLTVDMRR